MDTPTLSLILRVALVLALLPVIFVGASLAWNHAPLFDAPGMQIRLKTYLTTHVAETRDNHPFAELRPRSFDVEPLVLLQFGSHAVSALGWAVTGVAHETKENTINAVVTTSLWRFKDDVVIRVDASPAGGSILYVRSESRVGKGDLGANLRHVIDVTKEIERQVTMYKK